MNHHRAQTTAPVSGRFSPETSGLESAVLRVAFAERGPGETVIPLSADELLIGRGVVPPGWSTDDSKTSRVHARICWDPHAGGHRVGDAGSRNGTFVNGQPIRTALLEPGDVLRIGNTLAVYEVGDAMGEVRDLAIRAAASGCSLLILGETGVGKEVLARSVHERSGASGDFVAVNCAALPRDLIGSELFGHARGAFSGADRARDGLFVAANQGTLFLDEIGELPLEQQPVLLRALQERAVRPVGADREVNVHARVIAAAQGDLEALAASGHFRSDLYARIAQVILRVPPVRQRRREILSLLREFVAEGGRDLHVGADTAEALLVWSWPHNVREIKTLAGAFAALTDPGAELDQTFLRHQKPQLARSPSSAPPPATDSKPSGRADRERLRALLAEHAGNVAAVARALGKPRSQVYRWIERFGLVTEDFRQ